jgi:two-component system chemotaxis response regulator CheY
MSVNRSMPVLVVHDYPTMASIVTTLLKQIGFQEVEGASDDASAMKKLSSKNYGLVISDETMEAVVNGRLFAAMRAHPRAASTPVLMLTAPHDTAAQPLPCAATLAKPFNARTLQTTIDAMLVA